MITPNGRRAVIALLLVGAAWGCLKAPTPNPDKAQSAQAPPTGVGSAVLPERNHTLVPLATRAEKSAEEVSKVIGEADVTVHGKASCKIDFVYAGFEPEDLFWDGEACATVRAEMVDQTGLERLGKWQRLDDFERCHVNQLPGGKVLYVEGALTASIYPVGTTRLSYEVSVTD